jgi:hypothetical protein
MPTKNTLQTLIGLQVAIWIGQRIVADLSMTALAYVDPVTNVFGRTVGNALFIALVAALLGTSIGLIASSAVSRTLYLIVNIVAIVMGLLHGPIVRSGAADFCYSANILLTGVILTMVYSSPFKSNYEGGGGVPSPVMMAAASLAPVSLSAPTPPTPEPARNPERAVAVESSGGPSCGACGALTHGAKFCPQCGTPVVVKRAGVKNVCSRCGVESIPGEKFCRECGNPTP